MLDDFRVRALEGDAEAFCKRADKTVLFLRFLAQAVVDMQDDEALRNVFLLAALGEQKGKGHGIRPARDGETDATGRENGPIDLHRTYYNKIRH